jgi:flagellar motor switch protein FliM
MLSQYEIDALLSAAAEAPPEPSAAPAPGEPPPALSAVGRAVKTYDFRRPDKFSKDQLRTLQAIHENVARVAAARLSARLRTSVSISLADTAQMIYDEYVQELTLPSQLVVVANDGLRGPFLMDLDLGLALAGVERMLGGTGRVPDVRREPTPIESGLVDRIVDDLLVSIAEGWTHLAKLNLRVGETAFGPSLLRIAAPSHVVAVLTYEVRVNGQTAPVTLCYPHASLEALMPRLSASAWYAQPDPSSDTGAGRALLSAALRAVDIPVTAVLGSVALSVEALIGLQPGDTIRFEERAVAPVLLSVMDQARAWAQPGRVGDRMALRVVSPLEKVEA